LPSRVLDTGPSFYQRERPPVHDRLQLQVDRPSLFSANLSAPSLEPLNLSRQGDQLRIGEQQSVDLVAEEFVLAPVLDDPA
jgi:hypothetical protein